MEPQVQVALIVSGTILLGLTGLVWATRSRAQPVAAGRHDQRGLYQRLLDALAVVAREPNSGRARRHVDEVVNACVLSAPSEVVAVARRCQEALTGSGALPVELETQLLRVLRADLGLPPLEGGPAPFG